MEEEYFYHIYNRGINKSPIFFEKENYYYFLNQFKKYLFEYIDVYSYCLMPNHFHFLIRIKKTLNNEAKISSKETSKNLNPLEKAFKDFFISYAKSINKTYKRTGSIFQAKFKKKLITNDNYFNRLVAYIHLNPVRSKLCKNPEEWQFSSYNNILKSDSELIKTNEVLSWFGNKEAFIDFHKYYKDFLKERDLLFKD